MNGKGSLVNKIEANYVFEHNKFTKYARIHFHTLVQILYDQ